MKEIRDRCQVCGTTVKRWIDKGILRGEKLPSGTRRVRRSDFEAFLAGMKQVDGLLLRYKLHEIYDLIAACRLIRDTLDEEEWREIRHRYYQTFGDAGKEIINVVGR
jgi:hypothetical protein